MGYDSFRHTHPLRVYPLSHTHVHRQLKTLSHTCTQTHIDTLSHAHLHTHTHTHTPSQKQVQTHTLSHTHIAQTRLTSLTKSSGATLFLAGLCIVTDTGTNTNCQNCPKKCQIRCSHLKPHHVDTCTHMHTHAHTCTHTRLQTCTHLHKQTRTHKQTQI